MSELFLPLGGKVVAVNQDLDDQPELLNDDPYEHWTVVIEPTDLSEIEYLRSSST